MSARFTQIVFHPYSILLAVWLLALLVVQPFGEFPLNDDWAYAKNVYHLAEKNQFVVDPWPAMNLVAQTAYGTLVAKVFGFSLLTLRMSMVAMAVLTSLVLYTLFYRLTKNKTNALVLVLGFCFSAIYLPLSFSFMTDVFFLAMSVFAVYQAYRYHLYGAWLNYGLFIAFTCLAVLTRQHGLLLPLLLVGPVYAQKKISVQGILLTAAPLVLTWLTHDKYRHYLTHYGIAHNIQDTQKLSDYLHTAPFIEHYKHAGDLLLTSGWLLLPGVILLLLASGHPFKKRHAVSLISIALVVGILVYAAWPGYPQGNMANTLEIGPRTIKGDVAASTSLTLWWWVLLTKCIGFASIVLALLYAKQNLAGKSLKENALNYSVIVVAVVYFVFVSINQAYFDRYALPLALFVLLLMVPLAKDSLAAPRKQLVVGAIVFTVLFSTVFTRNYFQWQNTRWKAISYLEKKQIPPTKIDGGFEYNGWHAKDHVFSAPPKSWWWVVDDEYIVAKSRLKGYAIDTIFISPSFPFGSDTIFVLHRN